MMIVNKLRSLKDQIRVMLRIVRTFPGWNFLDNFEPVFGVDQESLILTLLRHRTIQLNSVMGLGMSIIEIPHQKDALILLAYRKLPEISPLNFGFIILALPISVEPSCTHTMLTTTVKLKM